MYESQKVGIVYGMIITIYIKLDDKNKNKIQEVDESRLFPFRTLRECTTTLISKYYWRDWVGYDITEHHIQKDW